MKNTLIIIAMMCAAAANAQNVDVVLKTGQGGIAEVVRYTTNTLYTNKGTFKFSDIDTLKFELKDQKYQELYDLCESKKLAATFTGYAQRKIVKAKEVEKLKFNPVMIAPTEVPDIELRLDRFSRQRTTGKTLQLIGLLATSAAVVGILNIKSPNDVNTSKAFAYGGAALTLTGFIIDIDAGKHLKKR